MNCLIPARARMALCCLAALTAAACARSEAPSSTESEVLGAPLATLQKVRPKVRHANWDGSQDESGSRLIKPEALDNVLTNSFGVELEMDVAGTETNPIQDEYLLSLGGIDYSAVTVRTTDVTSVMPLVMNRIAEGYCSQLIEGDVFDLTGSDTANIEEIYERIRSRPLSNEARDGAQRLLAATADDDTRWKMVCVYVFLIEGSMLLL